MSKPCWSATRYKGKYRSGYVCIVGENDYYENDNLEQTFAFDEGNYDYYYFTPEQSDFEKGVYIRNSWTRANIISSTEDEVVAIFDSEVRYKAGYAVDVYILKPSTQEQLDYMKSRCDLQK